MSIPTGTSTTLSGSASGGSGNYSYEWTPIASLVSSNVQNPQTNNLTNTTTFTLTVTDQTTTCTGTSQVIITVSGAALTVTPTATLSTICNGATTQLNAGASGGTGNYTYTWSDAATLSDNTLSNPIATPVGTTTYSVTVDDGNTTISGSIIITVNEVPTITGTTPSSRCDAGAVTLGAAASAGTINWYADATGGASLGTGTSFPISSISSTTTYYVDATDNGCTTASRTAVAAIVNTSPTVNLGNDTSVCANTYSLHAVTNAPSYVWSTGSIASTISITNTNTYSITVTGVSGCTAVDSIHVILKIPVEVSLGFDTSICDNTPVILNAGNLGSNYVWSTGAITQSIVVTTSGNYFVTVTSFNGCNGTDSRWVTYSKGVIKGKVTYNGTSVSNNQLSLHVYSISQQTRGGYDEIPATISISGQGNYLITNLVSDNYIVKAVILNHVNEYKDVLNSYYADADSISDDWATAKILTVSCDTVIANIHIGTRYNNGIAFGHVRGGVYYPTVDTSGNPLGMPVVGADVFLELNPSYDAVANIKTMTNGMFDFTYLKWGKYSIRVDLPGFDQLGTYTFDVKANDTILRNFNFIVDTAAGNGSIDTIIYLSVPDINNTKSSFTIYPNPFVDKIYIESMIVNPLPVKIEIINTTGTILQRFDYGLQSKGHHSFTINTHTIGLKSGTYYIRLISGNNVYVKKLIRIN